MGMNKIDAVTTTDLSNQDYFNSAAFGAADIYDDFWKVTYKDTDGATGQQETTFTTDWNRWHGYYRDVAIFAAAVDKLASFTVGRGLKADKKNEAKMKKIVGWGKDDFNSLLENQIRTALICGDSFAEIIKDKKGRILNLKPLSPGSIQIVVSPNGMLKHYEQINNTQTPNIVFPKEDIFHMCWNRIANEIHGIPYAERAEKYLKMIMESQLDQKVMFHRYVKPTTVISVDTDDTSEINSFKTKWQTAYNKSEPIIIPSETVGEVKTISTPQFSVHDPMPWLRYLIRSFVTTLGVPEVILGWGEQTTEASSKIIYLAYQQTIERLQRYVEDQSKSQLNIEFDLEFPASIDPELQEDEKKDGKNKQTTNFNVQPDKAE